MGAYDDKARLRYELDVFKMVTDAPALLSRTRKTVVDDMRAPTTNSAGPLVMRIDPFRSTRNARTFDEKGTLATTAFVALGVNRPDLREDLVLPKYQTDIVSANDNPTFKVGDRLTDADGNNYRITSPARWLGNVVEVSIELEG